MYSENLYFLITKLCQYFDWVESQPIIYLYWLYILLYIEIYQVWWTILFKTYLQAVFRWIVFFFNLSVMTEEGSINVLIYINTNVSKERSNGLFRSTLTLSLLLSKHIKTSHCQFTCKIGKNKVCLFKVSQKSIFCDNDQMTKNSLILKIFKKCSKR